MAPDYEPISWAAADLLARRDQVAVDLARRARVELPVYAQLPLEAVVERFRNSLVLLATMLRDRRVPVADELAVLRETGAVRAEEGVAVEDILASLRLGVTVAWAAASAEARRLGAEPEVLLEAHEHLWTLTDTVAREMTAGHRAAELVMERRAHQRRVDLVRALLRDGTPGPEVLDEARRRGLDPERAWVVFRGRAKAPHDHARLEEVLVAQVRDAGAGAVVPLGDDLVGLLTAAPEGLQWGTLGVSDEVPLAQAGQGFDRATEALTTALRFGLAGCHTLASLGVRTAVAVDRALGERLVARLVSPLRAGGAFEAELVPTLAAWFDHGMRLEETARALHVHPNTLRNRLRHYERLMAVDLRSAADLFAVWWAVQLSG